MGKALFLNLPAYGHINPTLPLVTELRRRGEAVVYVTMRRFQQDVEAAGAVFRAYEDLSDEVSAAFNPNVLRAPSVANLDRVAGAAALPAHSFRPGRGPGLYRARHHGAMGTRHRQM